MRSLAENLSFLSATASLLATSAAIESAESVSALVTGVLAAEISRHLRPPKKTPIPPQTPFPDAPVLDRQSTDPQAHIPEVVPRQTWKNIVLNRRDGSKDEITITIFVQKGTINVQKLEQVEQAIDILVDQYHFLFVGTEEGPRRKPQKRMKTPLPKIIEILENTNLNDNGVHFSLSHRRIDKKGNPVYEVEYLQDETLDDPFPKDPPKKPFIA